MTKEKIGKAAENYLMKNEHRTFTKIQDAFKAGVQYAESENERLKAERLPEQVSADYLYKDWLHATKRSGSVLMGSSVREFIQYLDSHFKITPTP